MKLLIFDVCDDEIALLDFCDLQVPTRTYLVMHWTKQM
jgi:hypothetical protein